MLALNMPARNLPFDRMDLRSCLKVAPLDLSIANHDPNLNS